jgi:hypothetical protein
MGNPVPISGHNNALPHRQEVGEIVLRLAERVGGWYFLPLGKFCRQLWLRTQYALDYLLYDFGF